MSDRFGKIYYRNNIKTRSITEILARAESQDASTSISTPDAYYGYEVQAGDSQGEAWKAIEGLGWKIYNVSDHKFELTHKEGQQLPVEKAKAFLREQIAKNLRKRILEGLKNCAENANVPDIHKRYLCKAYNAMKESNWSENMSRDHVYVRLYQLDEDKTKLYCVQQKETGDLYVVARPVDGQSAYGISAAAISDCQRRNSTSQSGEKGPVISGIKDQSLVPAKKDSSFCII